MDMQVSGPVDAGAVVDGPYLRRAQALLATRAELFASVQTHPVRLAGVAGPPRNRGGTGVRPGGRQLTLPLPRERGRRRARMVG
jgi:hypothetical protein